MATFNQRKKIYKEFFNVNDEPASSGIQAAIRMDILVDEIVKLRGEKKKIPFEKLEQAVYSLDDMNQLHIVIIAGLNRLNKLGKVGTARQVTSYALRTEREMVK